MKNILLWVYLVAIITLGHQNSIECAAHVITNPQQSDGFGSQFQTIIASVIYAELHNKKYVYTPFEMMEHNYHNEADFIAKKEAFINFIDNFDVIDKNENYSITSNIAYKTFFDKNVVACAQSRALKKIKKIFRANKNTYDYFKNENLNIAIHIRRPNSHDNRMLGSDTPDNVYMQIINQLRIRHSDEDPLFHIYSQGNKESFALFDAHDSILHLNESLEDTFLSMVLADILVTGTSSFSYTAGLLSEGIIYYMPFWHSPLPHWIAVEVLLKGKISS